MKKYAALVLAAGSSTRLGRPKQLLNYKGKTLIEHTINQLNSINNIDVFVVLGAHKNEILSKLDLGSVRVFINTEWKKGMGESIRFGVQKIQKIANYQGLLITLVDLPLVTADHYQNLLSTFINNSKKIAITQYEDSVKGVPIVIDSLFFTDLKNLSEEQGAKSLLKKHKKEIVEVNTTIPYFDVDTEESYQKLLKLS